MSRNHIVSPEQQELLPLLDLSPPPLDDACADKVWPSVRIDQRAADLSEALSQLNIANRAAGFQSAATNGSPDILARYGTDVAAVTGRAKERKLLALRAARDHVTRVLGEDGLIAAGLDAADVELLIMAERNDFFKKFGVGNASASKRNRQAEILQQSAQIITSGNDSSTQKAG